MIVAWERNPRQVKSPRETGVASTSPDIWCGTRGACGIRDARPRYKANSKRDAQHGAWDARYLSSRPVSSSCDKLFTPTTCKHDFLWPCGMLTTCIRQQSQEHINYSSIIFCSLGSTVYCTSFWSIAWCKLTHDQGIGCISLGWFFTWCANIMKFIGSCGWEHCVLSVDCWQAEQGDAYSCLCVESVSRQTYQFPTPQHLHMLHTLHSLQAVSYSLISAVDPAS